MEETEMAKKILGKKEATKEEKEKVDYLSKEFIWKATKKGCGTTVFNGVMTSAIMAPDDKKKAQAGVKKIESSNGFVFERQ